MGDEPEAPPPAEEAPAEDAPAEDGEEAEEEEQEPEPEVEPEPSEEEDPELHPIELQLKKDLKIHYDSKMALEVTRDFKVHIMNHYMPKICNTLKPSDKQLIRWDVLWIDKLKNMKKFEAVLRQETVKFNNQVVIDEEKIQSKKKEIPYFENMGAERKVKIRAEFANWEQKHQAKLNIDKEAAEETRQKTLAKLAILSQQYERRLKKMSSATKVKDINDKLDEEIKKQNDEIAALNKKMKALQPVIIDNHRLLKKTQQLQKLYQFQLSTFVETDTRLRNELKQISDKKRKYNIIMEKYVDQIAYLEEKIQMYQEKEELFGARGFD